MENRRGGNTLVETKIIKINSKNPDRKILWYAAKVIESGGIVVYPTETSYGIGTNAADSKAVKKLRNIRKPSGKPISIIVSSIDMMKNYGVITKDVGILVKKFMPGPLTIVVRKKGTIPNVLNKKEIAFRISSHPIANLLSEYAGVPITAPSANPEGKPPAFDAKKAFQYFNNKVDIVIDCGKLKKQEPSTMIDMKSKPKIIREGAISVRKIKNFIKF
jgi:L-threonylcarbamoyladenylate synthase